MTMPDEPKLPLLRDFHFKVREDDVEYFPPSMMRDLSTNSIRRHYQLGADDRFVYVVNNSYGYCGSVFSLKERGAAEDNPTRYGHVCPIISIYVRPLEEALQYRPHSLHGHKALRIHLVSPPHVRDSWAYEVEVFSKWCEFFAKVNGAIATKTKPLSGGKDMWKSFVSTGKVSALNITDGTEVKVAPGDDSYWSLAKQNILLVYRPE